MFSATAKLLLTTAVLLPCAVVAQKAWQNPMSSMVLFDKPFSYLGATLDWPQNPAWTCNGRSQSPIAVDTSKTMPAPENIVSQIERDFIAALPRGLLGTVSNLTLSNNNGGVTVGFGNWQLNDRIFQEIVSKYGNATQVQEAFNRTVGTPLQMHFHGIAENVVDGRLYPTELHIVRNQSASECQNDPSCFAVYGIFFTLPATPYTNATLPIIADLLDFAVALESTDSTKKNGTFTGETMRLPASFSINLGDLFPKDPSFFRFNGSLTGPPCTEGLVWTLFRNPQPIDIPDLQIMQVALANGIGEIQTNRFPQPLNGRMVYSVDMSGATSTAGRKLLETAH